MSPFPPRCWLRCTTRKSVTWWKWAVRVMEVWLISVTLLVGFVPICNYFRIQWQRPILPKLVLCWEKLKRWHTRTWDGLLTNKLSESEPCTYFLFARQSNCEDEISHMLTDKFSVRQSIKKNTNSLKPCWVFVWLAYISVQNDPRMLKEWHILSIGRCFCSLLYQQSYLFISK